MDITKLCHSCFCLKGDVEICPNCGYINGTPPQSPQQLPLGTLLNSGRYLIGRVLGHGGFGITYLALDVNLNMKLAVKEYLPHDLATRYMGSTKITIFTSNTTANFDYGKEKYLEEARTIAALSSYPGIVGIHNYFEENNTAYIVMEYLDGVTFKEFLDQNGGKITVETAMNIMQYAMDTLSVVHETGLLHRDISPDNIFISKSGMIKLLDFGASRYAMSEHSHSMSIILKPGFAPVEQYYSKGNQGPWTDVYATAATLYYAITGTALPESMERMNEDTIQTPSSLGIEIPQNVENALMKALAVKMTDRFQTIKEFEIALFDQTAVFSPAVNVDPTCKAETPTETVVLPFSTAKPELIIPPEPPQFVHTEVKVDDSITPKVKSAKSMTLVKNLIDSLKVIPKFIERHMLPAVVISAGMMVLAGVVIALAVLLNNPNGSVTSTGVSILPVSSSIITGSSSGMLSSSATSSAVSAVTSKTTSSAASRVASSASSKVTSSAASSAPVHTSVAPSSQAHSSVSTSSHSSTVLNEYDATPVDNRSNSIDIELTHVDYRGSSVDVYFTIYNNTGSDLTEVDFDYSVYSADGSLIYQGTFESDKLAKKSSIGTADCEQAADKNCDLTKGAGLTVDNISTH